MYIHIYIYTVLPSKGYIIIYIRSLRLGRFQIMVPEIWNYGQVNFYFRVPSSN